ncbi:MAG: hypothetical protein JWL64_180, partial [Frankiales bacterium]|nr:hypothetical protein [Frankiales bacterium]
GTLSTAAAWGTPEQATCILRSCVSGTADGSDFNLNGDEHNAGTPNQPAGGKTAAGSYTVHAYSFACSGNTAVSSGNICNGAVNCPDPTETRYWVYDATVTVTPGQPNTQSAWRLTATQCLNLDPATAPSLAAVAAQVETDFVRKRPATPTVTITPASGILVTLTNTLSAGDANPVRLPPDNILGLPVVITATPVRWHWDFGDHTTQTTTAPSTTHVWHTKGSVQVTATVEWTGTFTLAGFTGTFPITGTARVTSPPTTVTVHEARTQLVDR